MNFIGEFYLENLDICDQLIEFFNNSEYSKYRISGKVNDHVNEKVKKSVDMNIPTFDCSHVKCLDNYLYQLGLICEKYKKKYPMCHQICSSWRLEKVFNIQYYQPGGGFYMTHTERAGNTYPSCHRHLVFMTYLNDVIDGGETEFLNQNLKVKPKRGKTLIWPADWTHAHRGIPSQSQDKYIVTGWYTFDL